MFVLREPVEGGDLDHLLIKTNNELLIPEIAIFSEKQNLIFTLDYLDLNCPKKIMTHKESKCKHAEKVMGVEKLPDAPFPFGKGPPPPAYTTRYVVLVN